MEHMSDVPTHRLVIIAALYIEAERPLPVDLITTLNARGIIIEEEVLQCLA